MCIGPELFLPMIAGTALAAGGKMIEQGEHDANAERVAGARNKVLTERLAGTDKIADQTRAAFAKDQQRYGEEKVQARQAAEEDKRFAGAEEVATVPSALPTTADSPDIVKQDVARRMSEAVAKGKEKAKRQAKLGAFGDQWFQAGLGTNETGRNIALQSGFANQRLGLLPHLQDLAEVKAYKPVSPLGGVMMGAGNIVGSAAGSGYFKP